MLTSSPVSTVLGESVKFNRGLPSHLHFFSWCPVVCFFFQVVSISEWHVKGYSCPCGEHGQAIFHLLCFTSSTMLLMLVRLAISLFVTCCSQCIFTILLRHLPSKPVDSYLLGEGGQCGQQSLYLLAILALPQSSHGTTRSVIHRASHTLVVYIYVSWDVDHIWREAVRL